MSVILCLNHSNEALDSVSDTLKKVNKVLYSSQTSQLNNCVFEQIIGQRKMNRLKT